MRGLGSAVLFAVLLYSGSACARGRDARAADAPPSSAVALMRALPLRFEPNRGQTDGRAAFVAHGRGSSVYLTQAGALLALEREPPRRARSPAAASPVDAAAPRRAVALRYELAGARARPRIEGVDPLPGRSNYLLGADPKRWHTDVPQYRRVRYHDVQPGVDVVYYGSDGRLEFDIEVAPNADLAGVRLRIAGAEALALDRGGNLRVRTVLGDVVQRRPVVFQVRDGVRHELSASYVLQHARAGDEVAFAVSDYDPRFALVLDPVLDFGTYFGGMQNEGIYGLAIDTPGDIYIAGSTVSDAATFPETVGAYQTAKKDFFDAFVAKIKDDGSQLLYATYIGGDGNDFGNSLAVDAQGRAVLGGETGSDNYPVAAAVQGGRNGAGTSGIVTKLNAAGNGLVFSTYVGGNNVTEVFAIASDDTAATYVTGRSAFNSSFPTTAGAFQTTVSSASGSDAFVVKYDSTGARVYATLLGAGLERADGIAVDGDGSAYVAGTINVAAINGVTAHLIGPGGGGDAMIAKLNASGSALDYLTRIGGTSIEQAVAVTLDAANNAYFTGHSFSSDLPSTPAAPGNTNVALFGALDASGTALTGPGLTWYGSSAPFNPNCSQGGAFGTSVALDPNNPVAYVVGYGCPISTMPSVDPVAVLGCAPNCNTDTNRLNAFLLRYTFTPPPAGLADPSIGAPQALQAAPFLASATLIAGMSGSETQLWQTRTDKVGRVVAAGDTTGTVATANALDATANGGDDGILFRPKYNPVPPLLTKEFNPTTIREGSFGSLNFTVTNKNPADSGIALTGVQFDDTFKTCIQGLIGNPARFSPPACEGLFDASNATSGVFVKMKTGASLAPGQQCGIYFNIVAYDVAICRNQTSNIKSDQGTGNAASDVLDIEPVFESLWSRPTGQGPGNMSTGTNYAANAAPAANGNVTVPAGTSTSLISDPPALPPLHLVKFSGAGFSISGGTLSLGAGVDNAAAGTNTISAPVQQTAPLLFTNEQASSILNLSGGLDLNGHDAIFYGAGQTNIGGAISGSGNIDVTGIATIAANPTFTGAIAVAGLLTANATIAEATTVEYGGLLRGTGPFSGTVTVEAGVLYPGIGTAPFTLSMNALTLDNGNLGLRFSADNSVHSAVAASGAVAIVGALLLDFGATPVVNTTYSNLITAPGTISGCFDEVRATPANVVASAQCTASTVSAQVKAIDRVFASGFNY